MKINIDYSGMVTGRLKHLIDDYAPHIEWSPVGLLGGVLSAYSAMLPTTRVQRANGSLNLLLQMLLCGESGEGKGETWKISRGLMADADPTFTNSKIIDGVVGGSGLIEAIAAHEGYAFIFEVEFNKIARAAKGNASLSQTLRKLYDGDAVGITRGQGKSVRVEDPYVPLMAHTTPAEFMFNLSKADLAGGSFNRMMFVPVATVRELSERHRMPEGLAQSACDTFLEAVRHARKIEFVPLEDDGYDTADRIRAEMRTKVKSDEVLKPYGARVNEQIRKVAALYSLFDLRRSVTSDDLEAARAFVEYTLDAVADMVNGSLQPGVTLHDHIRKHLVKYGGITTRSVLLRSLGARATADSLLAAIDRMPDVEYYEEERQPGQKGRSPIIIQFVEDDQDDAQEPDNEGGTSTGAKIIELPRQVTPRPAEATKEGKLRMPDPSIEVFRALIWNEPADLAVRGE